MSYVASSFNRGAPRSRSSAAIIALARLAVACAVGGLLALAAAAPARAAPLDERAFTRELAEALRRGAPQTRIGVDGPLTLTIGEGDEEAALSLDNLFQEYRRDPAILPGLIERLVGAVTAVIAAPDYGPEDRGAIVPMIQSLGWLKSIYDRSAPDASPLVVEPLNSELSVVYGVDRGPVVGYLRTSDLAAIGVTKAELRALAVANLSTFVEGYEVHWLEPFHGVAAGGMYEASLMLMDDFWKSAPLNVEGEILAIIPSRGFMLIGGAADPAHVEMLGDLARTIAADQPYPISETVFVRRNGRFIPY